MENTKRTDKKKLSSKRGTFKFVNYSFANCAREESFIYMTANDTRCKFGYINYPDRAPTG